jgi:hypothetical protein
MHDNTVDELRREFIQAFDAYMRAGFKMRDVLLSISSINGAAAEENHHAIAEQQSAVTGAQHRYHNARNAYVGYVLADLTAAVA